MSSQYPRHVTPDPAALDCEQALETLGRLERLVIRLKEKACRGCDASSGTLIGLTDDLYSLLAEAMEDSK